MSKATVIAFRLFAALFGLAFVYALIFRVQW
jgi:hypothetical protein